MKMDMEMDDGGRGCCRWRRPARGLGPAAVLGQQTLLLSLSWIMYRGDGEVLLDVLGPLWMLWMCVEMCLHPPPWMVIYSDVWVFDPFQNSPQSNTIVVGVSTFQNIFLKCLETFRNNPGADRLWNRSNQAPPVVDGGKFGMWYGRARPWTFSYELWLRRFNNQNQSRQQDLKLSGYGYFHLRTSRCPKLRPKVCRTIPTPVISPIPPKFDSFHCSSSLGVPIHI